uniref:Putative salivary lipocalin n=1 Tax=Ixodes ricinus TaxID=34613 RepID=A0A0K8RH64_IXORI
MFLFLCAVFAAFGCSFGKTEDQKCFPKGVEHRLLHPPDAWKLMRIFNGTFYLVYHSEDLDFKTTYPCLNVRKSSLDESRKTGYYVYKVAPNTTVTLTGIKEVKTKKKDAAYKNPNMFLVQYHECGEYAWREIQLLYTDYITCAVLKSKLLGIQMWVSKTHLENAREIPWICALVYDLATDKPRRVSYDWKECPQTAKGTTK